MRPKSRNTTGPKVGTAGAMGAQEPFAGDALPADVSHAMGNTIATSNALFDTYNPGNMASVRKVHEARIKGRRRLREAGRTAKSLINGGSDGARTRDLRRDRPTL